MELHRLIVQCCLISQNYTWSENFLYLKSNNTQKYKRVFFNIFKFKACFKFFRVFAAFEEWANMRACSFSMENIIKIGFFQTFIVVLTAYQFRGKQCHRRVLKEKEEIFYWYWEQGRRVSLVKISEILCLSDTPSLCNGLSLVFGRIHVGIGCCQRSCWGFQQ